jgi:two-component system chemotaxis sensor kinase CheA
VSGLSQLPEDLLQELMVTFNVEARERLEAANRQLLALEASSDPAADAELVVEIFREVHSLKGAAAAVGLSDVRDLSHSLETLFERARSGEVLNPDVFDVVYQALDTIGSLIDGQSSSDGPDADIANLLAELDKAAVTGFETAKGGYPPPGDEGSDELDAAGATVRPDAVAWEEEGSSETVPPAAESSAVTTAATDSSTRAAEETIRVATAKLDSLMAQVGELLVASIGAQQRSGEVAELLDMLNEAEAQWRETRPRYRKLISQLASPDEDGQEATLGTRTDELEHLLAFMQESDEREQLAVKQLSEFRQKLTIDSRRMAQIVSDLQDEVRRTRMLPASTIFAGFPRVVRDVARNLGKEAQLVVKGGEIEVDRAVLEQIKDPLVHLLRNAVDHGLEIPDRRELNGKPPTGTITVEATQRGDSLVISVSDDGAGIDLDKVRKTAV